MLMMTMRILMVTSKPKKPQKGRSKFEDRILQNLTNRQADFTYEDETFQYLVQRKYKVDYYFPQTNIYVEAKGYLRSDDQRKMRAVKEQHPDIDIRFLFMKANSKVQGSKMTCQQWAEKYGFIWAEGDVIPDEWIFSNGK